MGGRVPQGALPPVFLLEKALSHRCGQGDLLVLKICYWSVALVLFGPVTSRVSAFWAAELPHLCT